MSAIEPKPRIATPTKVALGLIVLLVWTFAAGDWEDKGCTKAQGYGFVIQHGGWPDEHEGCEDRLGRTIYTDEYGR